MEGWVNPRISFMKMCQTDKSETNHDFRKLLIFSTNVFCVNENLKLQIIETVADRAATGKALLHIIYAHVNRDSKAKKHTK